MIDGYDVEVRLLAVTRLTGPLSPGETANKTKDAEQLIEYAGRICYDTTDRIGTSPGRIAKWLESGHESVMEHSSASFFIKASRVLTHELVRHRLASYSQRSQRYVEETEPRFVTPREIKELGPDAEKVYLDGMKNAWASYLELLKRGAKREIARYVLPGGCDTQIVVTMNFRELRHFIKLRTSKRSLPEIRAVAGEILRIMKEQAPSIFQDL